MHMQIARFMLWKEILALDVPLFSIIQCIGLMGSHWGYSDASEIRPKGIYSIFQNDFRP